MADPVGIEVDADALRDDVDEVILEVLRDPGDERDADGGEQQQADTAKELARGMLAELRRVVVDDVPEDQRVEQREDLVDRRQDEREDDDRPVAAQIGQQEAHGV